MYPKKSIPSPRQPAQNLPVTRDSVDARARLAAVPAVPELAVLAMPDGPGSLDAGFGSADPLPGAAIRDGGRRAPALEAAPTFGGATMEVARVMPEAGAAAGRAAPLVLLGATLSFAARLGRWMPAKRDAAVGTGAALVARTEPEPDEEVEPEELDDEP